MLMAILRLEWRTLMRGWRVLALFGMVAGIAAIVACGVLVLPSRENLAGVRLFGILMTGEAALTLLLVPLFTATAISREIQQHTLEQLSLTKLTGRDIVLGKLLSVLLLCFLSILCVLPMHIVALAFGKISPAQVLWTHVLLFVTAVFAGTTGLWWSTRIGLPIAALPLTYLCCAVWLVLVPLGFYRFDIYWAPIAMISYLGGVGIFTLGVLLFFLSFRIFRRYGWFDALLFAGLLLSILSMRGTFLYYTNAISIFTHYAGLPSPFQHEYYIDVAQTYINEVNCATGAFQRGYDSWAYDVEWTGLFFPITHILLFGLIAYRATIRRVNRLLITPKS